MTIPEGWPRQGCRRPKAREEETPLSYRTTALIFDASRTRLAVIAVIALVLLVLGLATGVGLFGWILAIILVAYLIAALLRGRRAG